MGERPPLRCRLAELWTPYAHLQDIGTRCSKLSSSQVAARSLGQNRTYLHLVDELDLLFIWWEQGGGGAANHKEATVNVPSLPTDRVVSLRGGTRALSNVPSLCPDRLVSLRGRTCVLFHRPFWFP